MQSGKQEKSVKVSGLVGRNRKATATSLALVFTAPFLPGRTNCSISQLFLFLFYPGGGGPNYLELKVQLLIGGCQGITPGKKPLRQVLNEMQWQ